ncbi:hypothetical protein [Pseudoleptotrichia goodfellowii]|uniref:Glycerophosphoryl diester phosphodiesterase membrane domain-containing protein n=1 Tax=Pseudoleptotrichia goodfellowii F0264 TaxID=596323 RepID=D0GM76_9FUSO|nr:hypothetical protein [Pseudoleptotrichia goodfellowii]EEY34821.1 hypothetical protein HMPREF0554_2322 [Pseudoleptotrichia goodfellowii F0264]
MEELKKSLSGKYLEMGEYFNKAFELFPKVMQKEVILVGIMVLLSITASFTMKTPLRYIIPVFSGIVTLLLLQKVIYSIDKIGDLSFEEEKTNNNMIKCIIIALFSTVPLVSLIFVIFCLIYPYFMVSYLSENMNFSQAKEYAGIVSPGNRMRIILPGFIITICISLITMPLIYIGGIGLVIAGIVSALLSILFVSIHSIIYLNVKYMNEKNGNQNNNQEVIEIEQ